MKSPYLSYKSRLRFFSNKLSPNKYQIQRQQNQSSRTNSETKFHILSKTFSHQVQPRSSKFQMRLVNQNISIELVQTIKKKALDEQQKLRMQISEAQKLKMYPSFVSRMLPAHKQHMEIQNYRSLVKNANEIQVRKLSTQNNPKAFDHNLSPQISKQGFMNYNSTEDLDTSFKDFDQTFVVLGRNTRRHTIDKNQRRRMNLTMDIPLKEQMTKKSFSRPFRKTQTMGIQRRVKDDQVEAWNDKPFFQEQSLVMFLQSQKVSLNEKPLKRKKKLSRSDLN